MKSRFCENLWSMPLNNQELYLFMNHGFFFFFAIIFFISHPQITCPKYFSFWDMGLFMGQFSATFRSWRQCSPQYCLHFCVALKFKAMVFCSDDEISSNVQWIYDGVYLHDFLAVTLGHCKICWGTLMWICVWQLERPLHCCTSWPGSSMRLCAFAWYLNIFELPSRS